MKNKRMLYLMLIAVLILGLIGCSGGGSDSGGNTSTPPSQTPTQKLVGTWNFVSGPINIGTFVFRTDGTGSFGGSGFHSGRIDTGVFYFTLDSGADEAFDITWNSDNNFTITNHNGGGSYTYSRAG